VRVVAHALHFLAIMRTTTTPTPAFASIDADTLGEVLGGCGKKKMKCCKPCPPPAPPPAAPAPLPPSDPGSSVDVSVSYNGQTTTAAG
jgi:hypothetical protein